jgi:hypothetical protein
MDAQPIDLTQPIVIDIKKSKKKRKYSRGLKEVQVAGRRMTRTSSRMVSAVAKGMDTFRKATDKSARRKRDGAIRDLGLNSARGLGRSLRESSRVPVELAKALDNKVSRRIVRLQLRAASRFSRVLRLR